MRARETLKRYRMSVYRLLLPRTGRDEQISLENKQTKKKERLSCCLHHQAISNHNARTKKMAATVIEVTTVQTSACRN